MSGCQLDDAARTDLMHTDPAAQAVSASQPRRVPETAGALVSAIEQVYPELLRSVEVQVARAGLARGHVGVREMAEEVIAEATARALQRVDRWEPDRGTRPWIAAFAANVIKERCRAAKTEREHRTAPLTTGADTEAVPDPLDALADLTSLIRDHMIELAELVTPAEWLLLRLAHVDEHTGVEIAARLGLSEGAARTRLSRAKAHFRDAYRLAERGGRGEHGEQGGRR